jgi:hypothetical protein
MSLNQRSHWFNTWRGHTILDSQMVNLTSLSWSSHKEARMSTYSPPGAMRPLCQLVSPRMQTRCVIFAPIWSLSPRTAMVESTLLLRALRKLASWTSGNSRLTRILLPSMQDSSSILRYLTLRTTNSHGKAMSKGDSSTLNLSSFSRISGPLFMAPESTIKLMPCMRTFVRLHLLMVSSLRNLNGCRLIIQIPPRITTKPLGQMWILRNAKLCVL